MTAIAKSDSQLDAEAQAPQRSLAHTIALHRVLVDVELRGILKLHQRDGEDQGIGVPFSHPFESYLDGTSKQGTDGWSAGAAALRRECRRSHSEHWHRDVWRGSQCSKLVYLVAVQGWDYGRACYELHLDPQRTERVVMRAFSIIESRLLAIQARQTETAHSDEGRNDWQAPAHVHHALGGLHAAECAQCLRGAA